MSVTTTSNTVTQTALHYLTDYDLHHSNETSGDGTVAQPNEREPTSSENPEWWPTDHRRVPNYRPINQNLDREMRPAGSNAIEAVFISTMLGGVAINANASRLWNKTGAKINKKMFSYPIGGER